MAIIKKIKVFEFLKSVFSELKFVEFPTRKETIRLSSIVLLISTVFGISLYLSDWALQTLRNLLTSFKF
jgi:preprotein translocase SecE subunit